MDNSTTSDTLDQADEDVLSYTVSDEALEAAAGTDPSCMTNGSCLAGSNCGL